MRVQPLSIAGSWLFTPKLHEDDRGLFFEAFTQVSFRATVGHPLNVQQANVSVSSKGTLRGIHFAEVPPGQAKYVQCYLGRILDVVVDVRVGSPTFSQWTAVELDSESRQAVFLSEGLGHAFCALSDSATVGYMCSEPHSPTREHGINPLDPQLGVSWPGDIELRLSAKDANAPTFAEALASGLLPRWEECQKLERFLKFSQH